MWSDNALSFIHKVHYYIANYTSKIFKVEKTNSMDIVECNPDNAKESIIILTDNNKVMILKL